MTAINFIYACIADELLIFRSVLREGGGGHRAFCLGLPAQKDP
jgi:hypothetical protein